LAQAIFGPKLQPRPVLDPTGLLGPDRNGFANDGSGRSCVSLVTQSQERL